MPAPPSSPARRALAALLVVLALVLVAGAAPAAPAPGPARQAPTSGTEGGTPDVPTSGPGATDATSPGATAQAEAQERADADLWAVWQVVIALAGVTVALLVLLLVYVRATSPRRAAAGERDREEPPFLAVIAADLAEDEGPPADPTLVGPGPGAGVAGGGDAPDADERVPVTAGAPPAPAPVPARPPARRAKRVEAPAKKLATPDAERVLVRPGRTPIRVPDPAPRTDGRPPTAPASPPPPPGGGSAPPPGPGATDGR